MKKVYLKAGEEIHLLTAGARVGPTGTVVDIFLDLSREAVARDTGDEGIGYVVKKAEGYDEVMHFAVHIEEQTGRLYIDEDEGQ